MPKRESHPTDTVDVGLRPVPQNTNGGEALIVADNGRNDTHEREAANATNLRTLPELDFAASRSILSRRPIG